jgi:hypothetical protein
MSKLPKDKRNKIILVVAGTLLVSVGLWVTMVNPLRTNLKRAVAESAEARARLTAGQRTLASWVQVSNDVAAAQARLLAAEETMASGDLYVWMIQTMNRFKASQQVDIPQIGKETRCEVGVLPAFPYQAAAFAVRGTGFYNDIGKFVADFENAFPYMRVQNLELEPVGAAKKTDGASAGNVGDDETLQFRMEIVTMIKPVAP